MMSWSAIWLTIAFYFSLSLASALTGGQRLLQKTNPLLFSTEYQQRQLASQCRKNVEKSFMQIYVSWRVCVVQSGAAGGLVDFQNGSIMLFSCPLAEKAPKRWRGSNECIFQHELGGITHTHLRTQHIYVRVGFSPVLLSRIWIFSSSTHFFNYTPVSETIEQYLNICLLEVF